MEIHRNIDPFLARAFEEIEKVKTRIEKDPESISEGEIKKLAEQIIKSEGPPPQYKGNYRLTPPPQVANQIIESIKFLLSFNKSRQEYISNLTFQTFQKSLRSLRRRLMKNQDGYVEHPHLKRGRKVAKMDEGPKG